MSLILTILALVFFTELIAWIGKSVLLDLVRPSILLSRVLHEAYLVAGMGYLPKHILWPNRFQTTKAQNRAANDEKRTATNERTGPICQVGQVEEECGQGSSRTRKAQ